MTIMFKGGSAATLAIATSCLVSACTSEESLGNSARSPVPYSTLATGPASVLDIHTDNTYVYWMTEDGDLYTIHRVPKAGGEMETVGLLTNGPMRGFRIDGDYLYALENGTNDLVRVRASDGETEIISEAIDGDPALLAVDGDWIYALTVAGNPASSPSALWRVATTGGLREDIFPSVNPSGFLFATNSRGVSWLDGLGELWFKPNDSAPTRAMPSLGNNSEDSQQMVIGFALDADKLVAVTSPEAPPGGFDYPLAVVEYNLDTGSTHDLGGASAFPVVSIHPTPTGWLMLELRLQQIGDVTVGTSSLALYPSDGSGRRLVWSDIPGYDTLTGASFEPDGSVMYWLDGTTGDVNRYDIDLAASTVQ